MRWTIPLALAVLALALAVGIPSDDESAGGSPPPWVEVEFMDNESPPHIIMRVVLAPGDTIPAKSIPELPDGMIAWASTGYTPFDFSTPIYEWTALHPIDHIPGPTPTPDPPAPHREDPDGHAGLWAAFIIATAVLAVVTYRLRRD